MKRSEAILIIRRAMSSYDGAYYDDEQANLVLEQLELAGMRPQPYRNKQNSVSYDWEPEDDI